MEKNKRSDAETLQEYYQRINDIIDDRNRLQHENALMREQLGVWKRKPLRWRICSEEFIGYSLIWNTYNGRFTLQNPLDFMMNSDEYRFIPLQDILDLIEEDE